MSLEFLETTFDKVSYLQNTLASFATGGSAEDSEYQLLRSELLKNEDVKGLLPSWLRTHRDLGSFWGFIKNKFSTYAERRTFLSQEFTPALDYLEFGVSPSADLSSSNIPVAAESPSIVNRSVTRNKRKVFIVHGRDDVAKLEVSQFIGSLGLDAIILHEQANSGMTIIEKIERYTNDADYALVLYTACDQGRGHHEKNLHPKDRARQNVVFEHGYLMAKLGRDNVCSLRKGDIETPNDLSGVVYVDMDSAGAWKMQVAKELKECGYSINSFF